MEAAGEPFRDVQRPVRGIRSVIDGGDEQECQQDEEHGAGTFR